MDTEQQRCQIFRNMDGNRAQEIREAYYKAIEGLMTLDHPQSREQTMSISTHSTSSQLPIGTFVSVGDDIGTIIGWPDSVNIPEEHYAVWFGEKSAVNLPRCRTVPFEYCVALTNIDFYH